jgi:hypothetical protein
MWMIIPSIWKINNVPNHQPERSTGSTGNLAAANNMVAQIDALCLERIQLQRTTH